MNAAQLAAPAESSLALHLDEARRLSRHAVAVLLIGVVPVAVWLALAPLSSAVVAQAFVKVDLDRRPVQHAEGGIVSEVLVRDGQQVAQGEPLLVLGDVAVDAELNRLNLRVMTERASLARQEAEQLGADEPSFSDDLLRAAAADPRVGEQVRKERALFDARRDALTMQVKLLRAQRRKVEDEGRALKAQIARAGESERLQRDDLETQRKLLAGGFISSSRIAQLEAPLADYGVKLEERRSEHARAGQRLIDTELKIQLLRSDYRQQASDQVKVTTARLAELQQELRKSKDLASRQIITAPVAGVVVNLKFTSPGSVVSPREPIADLVPTDPRLVIEAHLRPEDVARVHQDQAADIRFSAYDHRSTRLVTGRVIYVAADRAVDRANNQPYITALVEADKDSLAMARDIRPSAGMPAEIFIRGDSRTPLQYLLDPVTQSLRRAARER